MLHHVSIAVDRPERVAKVLAEILNGKFFEFPIYRGAYMTIVGDAYGTAIEILPLETAWLPGQAEAEVMPTPAGFLSLRYSPTHVAMSVPGTFEHIEAIGAREDWLVRLCDRGPFKVIELWVENRVMFEFLTTDIAQDYLNFMNPETYAAFLEHALAGANV